MILTGSAVKGTGNTMNNIIEGNELANTLYGMNGDDRLDGKAGADTLVGGQGSDTFIVDNIGDLVVEKANEGWDKVQASVSFTLAENVEDLILTGTAAKGVGNSAANKITGNDAANTLLGAGGNDTLFGNGGNDILNGGAGNDKMTGGAGIDTFLFEKGFGKDVITDFQLGTDKLDLTALGGVKPVISSSTGGAILSWGADTITLVGVSANDPMLKAMFVA
jgi:Ca2+-binding RTX toxin-like protein